MQLSPPILSDLRYELIRQEETIIFALIERAQFKLNPQVYEKGSLASTQLGSNSSFLDYFLKETEKLHSKLRRYTEENPFFPQALLKPILPVHSDKPLQIQPNAINLNDHIYAFYVNKIVPSLCTAGSDGNFGSVAAADIQSLQAISKRVHFGKHVAEAKFSADADTYKKLILANDAQGLMKLLTNAKVEKNVLQRVRLKAMTYGRGIEHYPSSSSSSSSTPPSPTTPSSQASCSTTNTAGRTMVDAELIVGFYRDLLIPLTKQVQVAYLLQRLSGPSVAFLGPAASFTHQAAQMHFKNPNNPSSSTAKSTIPVQTPEFIAYSSIQDVFHSVLGKETLYGVVPYENSGTGKIRPTLEQLCLRQTDSTKVQIIGDIYLPISQCLLTKATQLTDIDTIYSHPQGFLQCKAFLDEHFPPDQVQRIACASTAKAASLVSTESSTRTAAIASPLASEHYKLPMLRENIQCNRTTNVTRFLVIAKPTHATTCTSHDRTMLLFGVKDAPGVLCSALKVFQALDVNLQAIETYKDPLVEWQQNFFVECDGHLQENPLQQAIHQLKQETTFVTTLGSFFSKAKDSS